MNIYRNHTTGVWTIEMSGIQIRLNHELTPELNYPTDQNAQQLAEDLCYLILKQAGYGKVREVREG